MPPAWVDFSWAVVQGKRNNVKHVSVIITVLTTCVVKRHLDEAGADEEGKTPRRR
jgi:hypothetical protein